MGCIINKYLEGWCLVYDIKCPESWVECQNWLKGDLYGRLSSVLLQALAQASEGKGKERHAAGNAFEDQPICAIQHMLVDHPFGFQAGQVIKKVVEAGRLFRDKGSEAAKAEILGAINYAAAMVVLIEGD